MKQLHKYWYLFPGAFQVLAYILIILESNSVISIKYDNILLPNELVQKWNQVRDNHYKLEWRQMIGYIPPKKQDSSLILFWPEETLPYDTRGRITFFECINQTPAAARAWMRVIRGGIGTSELVLEVMYEPIEFRQSNILIVACYIYIENFQVITNQEKFLWNFFDITTSRSIKSATVQEGVQIFKPHLITNNSTAESAKKNNYRDTTPMVKVDSIIQMSNSTRKLKGANQKSGSPNMQIEKPNDADQEKKPKNSDEMYPPNEISSSTNINKFNTKVTIQGTAITTKIRSNEGLCIALLKSCSCNYETSQDVLSTTLRAKTKKNKNKLPENKTNPEPGMNRQIQKGRSRTKLKGTRKPVRPVVRDKIVSTTQRITLENENKISSQNITTTGFLDSEIMSQRPNIKNSTLHASGTSSSTPYLMLKTAPKEPKKKTGLAKITY